MPRHLALALFGLLVAVVATPATAREADWVLLGEQSVKFPADRDVIAVGRREGRFSRIRLGVRGSAVFLQRVQIKYMSGAEESFNIGQLISDGGQTPNLDLTGERRAIREIVLTYKSLPSIFGRATVQVFGELMDDRGPPGFGPGGGDGRFEVIGTESYDRFSERIVFRIGRDEGRFDKIKLRARDQLIRLDGIQIVYADGERQTVDFRDNLERGDETPAIDLEGRNRAIREVVVLKRPSWRREEGHLELLASERPRERYQVLDTQKFDRFAERIVFRVGRRDGPVTSIKLRAVDQLIRLDGMQVRFNNGEKQTIDLKGALEPGAETRPIDLPGDRRIVEEVVVLKRPSWRREEGRLELLGLEPPRRPPSGPPAGRPEVGIPGGWVLFGMQSVDFGVDRDVISVGRQVGLFDRIALRVLENDIHLREITIVFANGDRERKPIDALIPANSRTWAIEIRGDRFIDRIELVYRSRPDVRRGRAVVQVYGEYSDSWLSDRGPSLRHNQGWVLLGAQYAQLFSTDADKFTVGARFGRFKSIRLTARGHTVRVMGLKIVYGNGDVENVPIFGELSNGQSSQPFDLKGRNRFIDRVELRYRTKLNFAGQGLIEVWGRR